MPKRKYKRNSRSQIQDIIGVGGLANLESAGFAVVRVADVMPLIEALRGPMLTNLMMGAEGVKAAPEGSSKLVEDGEPEWPDVIGVGLGLGGKGSQPETMSSLGEHLRGTTPAGPGHLAELTNP